MVGGSLRVLRLLPPFKLVTMILLPMVGGSLRVLRLLPPLKRKKGALDSQLQVIKYTSCLSWSVVLSGYSGFLHH